MYVCMWVCMYIHILCVCIACMDRRTLAGDISRCMMCILIYTYTSYTYLYPRLVGDERECDGPCTYWPL